MHNEIDEISFEKFIIKYPILNFFFFIDSFLGFRIHLYNIPAFYYYNTTFQLLFDIAEEVIMNERIVRRNRQIFSSADCGKTVCVEKINLKSCWPRGNNDPRVYQSWINPFIRVNIHLYDDYTRYDTFQVWIIDRIIKADNRKRRCTVEFLLSEFPITISF